MAANAVEVGTGWRARWADLLKASPERWEFTTRLALICTVTTLVTEVYQTPDWALAAYLPFFLNRPERTLSLVMSVALTIVIALVIALILLVARGVVDYPGWRVASIAVASFALLFLGSASKLKPIASTVALIVGYALALLGTIKVGEEATRALLYVLLLVAIAAGVSIVVNLVFGPAPRRTAERAISERLRIAGTWLREPENAAAQRRFRESLNEGVGDILKNLKFGGLEKSAPARDLAALHQAALSTWALTSALEVLDSNPGIELPGGLRVKIAATLEEMADILDRGGYPVEVTLEWPAERLSSPVENRVVAEIREALTRFAEPAPDAKTPKKEGGGFFTRDAFTNPEHVEYALKTTGAAVFCYCLYSLLDWPGIHTAFLTCYIVALTTAAESVEKLTLRILGCLLGAAVGYAAIVFLVPSLTSIGGLLAAVFVGTWFAAYVAAGSERISYVGFQAAFAFFLCILQGPRPEFDLTTARDRIIGILVGNFVAYIAYLHIAPVSITRRIDPGLAAALERLKELVLSRDRPERVLVASEFRSGLTALETDLELAHYEPHSVRASDAWLSNRLAAVGRARSLGPLLLLGTDQGEVPTTAVAQRLEVLAEALSSDHPADTSALERTSAPRGTDLPSLIEQHLRGLERAIQIESSGVSGYARA